MKLIVVVIRFHRNLSSFIESHLSVQEFIIVQSRDRSQDAKNRRKQTFEISTNKLSSTFERIEMKMTTIHEENVVSRIQEVVHRANLTFERDNRGLISFREMTSSEDRGRESIRARESETRESETRKSGKRESRARESRARESRARESRARASSESQASRDRDV